MIKHFITLTNTKGDVLAGSVAVINQTTGARQAIFSDANGTAISNNLAVANSDGLAQFWVARGKYNLSLYQDAAGATFLKTISDVFIGEPYLAVDVKDYGAVGDGVTNDTTAIQAAINSNATEVRFPAGTYLHGNLTCDNDYQRFVGHGARLVRNANSTTITVSARGNQFHGMRFSGGSFTGNNITVTGPETEFYGCDSIETPGRAIIFSDDGGGGLILGGVWNTTTSAGYEIELFDTTPGTSLYTKIVGISTQQSGGGILINGQSAVRVTDCQIGKLTVSSGSGFFTGNRIVGAASIQSSINLFNNNSFAANVTFGDGSGGAITQITFGPTNVVQSGSTLTINSEVSDSSFHLGQLTGVTLVLNAPANDLWHGEIAYTPTLVGTGSPALGNGTLTGKVSRQGRQWTAAAELVVGSTTTLGSAFGISAPHKAATTVQGVARLTDTGTGSYSGVAEVATGASQINVYAGSEPISGTLTPTAPFTWATGDILRVTISGQYVA